MAGSRPPQFDLLIKNGRVIDPANGVDAVMDVAVAGTKIARVAANIDPAQARRVVDATGLHVVPGLIDIHAHVFFGTEKDAYLSNSRYRGPARQPLVPQRPDDARRCRAAPDGATSSSSRSRSSIARARASCRSSTSSAPA